MSRLLTAGLGAATGATAGIIGASLNNRRVQNTFMTDPERLSIKEKADRFNETFENRKEDPEAFQEAGSSFVEADIALQKKYSRPGQAAAIIGTGAAIGGGLGLFAGR